MQATNSRAFSFTITDHGEAAVFQLSGPPSLEGAAELRKAFWECLHDDGKRVLILDLSRVPSLGPSVVSLFISTKNVVDKHRGRLVLAGLNRAGRALLEETHLHDYFEHADTLDEVLTAL
ncbi:MAG: STAS domain-containing protein [Acidobacteriota bacterium]|nr:STAS domain-containing protein [Acidobacteriota bacterium]